MKFFNINLSLIAVSFLLLLSSCFTERIDIDLNGQENKKVVITGWLNDMDQDQYIQVYYSGDYFNGIIDAINDAEVTLSYNSETVVLSNTTNGMYLLPSDWKGEEGTEYTLSVTHEGEEYKAVSLLRFMPELENIQSVLFTENDSVSYYEIYFDFQENPGEGDGYFAIDYLKDSDQKNIIRTGGWTDDEFADGEYLEQVTVTQNNHQLGDTIILEAHSIGKEATEYFYSIDSEIFREGLLDPPPVNVPTNFSNGAVGYFLTSGKRKYEVIVE